MGLIFEISDKNWARKYIVRVSIAVIHVITVLYVKEVVVEDGERRR